MGFIMYKPPWVDEFVQLIEKKSEPQVGKLVFV